MTVAGCARAGCTTVAYLVIVATVAVKGKVDIPTVRGITKRNSIGGSRTSRRKLVKVITGLHSVLSA